MNCSGTWQSFRGASSHAATPIQFKQSDQTNLHIRKQACIHLLRFHDILTGFYFVNFDYLFNKNPSSNDLCTKCSVRPWFTPSRNCFQNVHVYILARGIFSLQLFVDCCSKLLKKHQTFKEMLPLTV